MDIEKRIKAIEAEADRACREQIRAQDRAFVLLLRSPRLTTASPEVVNLKREIKRTQNNLKAALTKLMRIYKIASKYNK
ncbi:MAG: hypothetical protein ACHQRJ_16835 [Alphaproteobacteria bacterium]